MTMGDPRASCPLHVSHDKHRAQEVVVAPDPYHPAHRHDPPRCSPGYRQGASLAGMAGQRPPPATHGQADVGLDLIRNIGTDSANGSQRLRDQCEPGGIPPTGNAADRHLDGAAEFGFGQQPQVGFRALAVHVPSVLPRWHWTGKPGGHAWLDAPVRERGAHHAGAANNTQSPAATWSGMALGWCRTARLPAV
jgi:hypothetical protein